MSQNEKTRGTGKTTAKMEKRQKNRIVSTLNNINNSNETNQKYILEDNRVTFDCCYSRMLKRTV